MLFPPAEMPFPSIFYVPSSFYSFSSIKQFSPTLLPWLPVGFLHSTYYNLSVSSVTQSCPILCNPMNCSTPGLPVHHQLPEFTQTHVHRVGDAIQVSHLLSSPSTPAPNPSQHQSLFQWVNSSHEVAKVLSSVIFNNAAVFFSQQLSCSVMSDSLWPHGLQHTRLPCPSPTPGACSNSCPSSQWWHPTISSSVIPFSSCLQSFPASGSFQMSHLFALGGQSIGVSASVLLINIQDWFPLGWTGWISLKSKGLSRVSSNTTVQKH